MIAAPPTLWIPRTDRRIGFQRPLVMGILNLNDDSFCGDGTLDHAVAAGLVRNMLEAGADCIDIGAESARTNRAPISTEEEIARLRPFFGCLPDLIAHSRPMDQAQLWPPLISLNTWRPAVAGAILPMGCDLLNDMGALPDDSNARICARHGAALLIMHSVGRPKEPHGHIRWDNILDALDRFFREKITLAVDAGVSRDAIILDPGIDFAKPAPDNLSIYCHAASLAVHNRPVLLPVSRKTVIGETLGITEPCERDPGTLACLVAGARRLPAVMFRVHNVPAAATTTRVLHAIASARAKAPKAMAAPVPRP